MNRKLNIGIALTAGLIGGGLSRYLNPFPVLAQTQLQKELRAQSFVLVDDKDRLAGTFKAYSSPSGPEPVIVLLDRHGKEIWRAGVSAKVLTQEFGQR
jgi:hypothetical protein